jgi:ribose transport system permease protein
MAFAAMLPLICGHLDISVGANAVFCSILTAAAMSRYSIPMMGAVALGIGAGALVGAINGALVARAQLNAIVATLGSATVLGGIVLGYTDGIAITTGISSRLTDVGIDRIAGIPVLVIVTAVIALAIWYWLEQTPFGRRLAAIGSNSSAASLVGIRVERLILVSFIGAGALAGIAGVLLVARQGTGNPSTGPFDVYVPAITAVFLGATAFRPGAYNVAGTVLGLYFLAAIVSGLTLMGVEPYVSALFQGTSLIAAASLTAILRGRSFGSAAARAWPGHRRSRSAAPSAADR